MLAFLIMVIKLIESFSNQGQVKLTATVYNDTPLNKIFTCIIFPKQFGIPYGAMRG